MDIEITGREFQPVAAHLRSAYLRYSFTKGTAQEVAFLVDLLGLDGESRVLDVGCGPGRHCAGLAETGVHAVGLDLSLDFLKVAGSSGSGRWVQADARDLPFAAGTLDVAMSLCQGGFGLLGGFDDVGVLAGMARTVRPGGKVVVSAFSSYFAVRHQEQGETFYADAGVNHERTSVKDPQGKDAEFDLFTTCFTPRELRLMASAAGLRVCGLWAVTPGQYGQRPPDLDHPEFLMVGEVGPSPDPPACAPADKA